MIDVLWLYNYDEAQSKMLQTNIFLSTQKTKKENATTYFSKRKALIKLIP